VAKIRDEEIERLKREVSVERLVAGFGVEVKRPEQISSAVFRFTTTARRRW
jgi:hypothetical protein